MRSITTYLMSERGKCMPEESPRTWSDFDIRKIVGADLMEPIQTEQSAVVHADDRLCVQVNRVRNVATNEAWQSLRVVPVDVAQYVAVIVPVLRDGRLLFVGRYRYALERWTIELPRFWSVTDDAGWKYVANDQLHRHVGIDAKKLTLWGAIQPDSARAAGNTVVIRAEDCVQRATRPADPRALVAGTVGIAPDELYRLILRGDVDCGVSLAALHLYDAHARRSGNGQRQPI